MCQIVPVSTVFNYIIFLNNLLYHCASKLPSMSLVRWNLEPVPPWILVVVSSTVLEEARRDRAPPSAKLHTPSCPWDKSRTSYRWLQAKWMPRSSLWHLVKIIWAQVDTVQHPLWPLAPLRKHVTHKALFPGWQGLARWFAMLGCSCSFYVLNLLLMVQKSSEKTTGDLSQTRRK